MTAQVNSPAMLTGKQIAQVLGCSPKAGALVLRAVSGVGQSPAPESVPAGDFEAWLSRTENLEPIRGQVQAEIVYFIQDNEAVKIGHTVNLPARLHSLQAANPRPLSVLATFHGGRAVEAYFHGKFRRYRIHGEWFRNAGKLLEFTHWARV